MHPYKLVKDVRTAEETSDVDGVMNGNIDRFAKAIPHATKGRVPMLMNIN